MDQKTKERYRKNARAFYINRMKLIASWKAGPCEDCGKTFPPECMQFDHVRGDKLFEIGRSVCIALHRVLTEVKKCDLVCANCHAIRTKKRRQHA
jgi:hypothetical protein